MRPFESNEYSLLMSGSLNRFGRGLNNRFPSFAQSHQPTKKQPLLYMVPTTPSKPAFFMQPNNYRSAAHHHRPIQPPQTSPAAHTFLNHDYERYATNNLISSNQNHYANKCERFPVISGNNNIQMVRL